MNPQLPAAAPRPSVWRNPSFWATLVGGTVLIYVVPYAINALLIALNPALNGNYGLGYGLELAMLAAVLLGSVLFWGRNRPLAAGLLGALVASVLILILFVILGIIALVLVWKG